MKHTIDPSAYSTFFFAVPTFVTGLARVFDFAGTMTQFNRIVNPYEADRRAIAADFAAIMADLHKVVEHERVVQKTQ